MDALDKVAIEVNHYTKFWELRFDITEQWFPGTIRDVEALADLMLGPEFIESKGIVNAFQTLRRISLVRIRRSV